VVGEVPEDSEVLEAVREGEPASGFGSGGWEVGIPVETRAGTVAVLASASNQELSRGVATAIAILAGVGILVIVAAVVVADRLGRSLVQPVDKLAEVARRLGQGELEARAAGGGPPEVAAVGAALNELADRLGEMITAERESLADLSHRLRTPLTGLRLQAERLAESEDRLALLAGVDRMQEAVDGLIQSVRQGQASAHQSDLAEVVRRRLEFWRVLAQEQGRNVTAILEPGPLAVAVGGDEAGSMVDGLVGNIFAHTPTSTGFEVKLHRLDSAAVELLVGDGGPGFPAGFDPLRRGASGAGSTGLGLDIARRVAERCGGSVRLGRSALGGAEVAVILRLG
jgi:signal transduction histidine kinase